jgi:hypothetical protein
MTRLVFAFVALLLIPSCLLAQSQKPSPSPTPQDASHRPYNQASESTQHYSQDNQCGSEQLPFVIKIQSANNSESQTEANRSERTDKRVNNWTLSDKIAMASGIALFAQYVALIITTVILIRNGHRQLRAYVLAENVGIVDGMMLTPPQPERANIPGVGMIIKNFGQTPAYKVISWAKLAVIAVTDEISLVLPPITEQFYTTLGPGASFNKAFWFDRPLAANEIADIAIGTRAVYLYGRIEYRDAFKKRRCANFRLRYIGAFPPPQGAMFWFCETGNDAD